MFVGGVSFGFAGFAFAVFATASLSLASPPQVAIPAVMLVADTLALPALWLHRAHLGPVRKRKVPPFTPASLALFVVGVVSGALLLGRVPANAGRLTLALVILAFVAFQVRRAFTVPTPAPPTRWWRGPAAAGFGGGLVDGWLGTGGVVIAMFLATRRLPPESFVAAIVAYFLATDVMRAVAYGVLGYWAADVLTLYLRTVPVALAGYLLGMALRWVLASDRVFRAVVLVLLTAYALALTARAALGR